MINIGATIAVTDSVGVLFWTVAAETAKFWVSVGAVLGTTAALFFAGYQYRRAEKWRRSEFVASQVKEFEAIPEVRNTLTMIDWSTRSVNLTFDASLHRAQWPVVSRGILWKALLPHTIKKKKLEWRDPAINSESGERELTGRGFSAREATIRDTFDVFLDGLERFGNFVSTGLVSVGDVKPYLQYWLDDLATAQGKPDGARWRCVLLVYIHVYRFAGVQRLFAAFKHDIRPGSELFEKLRVRMEDDDLYSELMAEVRRGSYLMSALSDEEDVVP